MRWGGGVPAPLVAGKFQLREFCKSARAEILQRQGGGESFVEVAYGLAEDGRGMQLREAIDVLVDAGAATADAKVRLGLALRSRVSEGGPLVLLAELDIDVGALLRAAWRRV